MKSNPVITIQKHIRGFLVRKRNRQAQKIFEEKFKNLENKDEFEWAGAIFKYPKFSGHYKDGINEFLKVLDEIPFQ